MATIHRLNSGWTLTDGIIAPIRLDRPMTIYAALRTAGLVPDAHFGMDLTAAEWLYARRFVYEKEFDLAPAADTERTELHFDHMYGDCTVCVNGAEVIPYAPGCYDVTAHVHGADNRLTVSVAPEMPLRPFDGDPLPARGISGSVSMQGVNRITLHSADFSAGADLCCDMTVDAHISGKYHFTCILSREGEAIATHDCHQRLIAAKQDIQLHFPLPENASGAYDLLLTIEHNGLLCDQLRGSVMAASAAPDAVCHIDGDPRAETEEAIYALLPLLKQAGFAGVSFQYIALCTRRIETRMQALELVRAEYDPTAPAFTGCMDAAALKRYARGIPCWPPHAPAWKLRHSDVPDMDAASARWGRLPADDIDRQTAAIRLTQAQQVFDAIVAARIAGKGASIRCHADAFPRFGSAALTAPALAAATQALQPLLAVFDMPETVLPCSELLKLPVVLLSRHVRPLPVTVTATLYAPDGSVLSGVSFSAIPNGAVRPGELNCQIPADLHHVLLRTAVEQPGEPPVICDRWVACGAAPAVPADLPHTLLEADGDTATCREALAIGVVTARGIRVLLPGESAGGYAGECFNA